MDTKPDLVRTAHAECQRLLEMAARLVGTATEAFEKTGLFPNGKGLQAAVSRPAAEKIAPLLPPLIRQFETAWSAVKLVATDLARAIPGPKQFRKWAGRSYHEVCLRAIAELIAAVGRIGHTEWAKGNTDLDLIIEAIMILANQPEIPTVIPDHIAADPIGWWQAVQAADFAPEQLQDLIDDEMHAWIKPSRPTEMPGPVRRPPFKVPEGYVSAKTVTNDAKWMKQDKKLPRSTLESWEQREVAAGKLKHGDVLRDPDTKEKYYPAAWLQTMWDEWIPRGGS